MPRVFHVHPDGLAVYAHNGYESVGPFDEFTQQRLLVFHGRAMAFKYLTFSQNPPLGLLSQILEKTRLGLIIYFNYFPFRHPNIRKGA